MRTLSPTDKKFYIIALVTVIIMYGTGFLPTFGQVTPAGMRVLGIFLGCIFAWCFGELVWSSILGLASLVIINCGTTMENFASAFANNTTATIITAFVFCCAIEKSGLLAEFSKWILGRKWAQKGPWGLVFGFYLAAVILALMAANPLPPIILLWALFYEMAKEIGIKPYDPLSVIILCGIGVSTYVGVAIIPYSSMTVVVRGAAESFDPNFVFNIGEYMLLNFIVPIIYLPIIVFVLKLLAGKKVNIEMPKREQYRMNLNMESKISLCLLLIVILSMIIPNFLPEGNFLRVLFNDKLTIVGTFMIASVILMIIRVNGKPVLDIAEGISSVPWHLVLIVSSALAISNFITADETGIMPTIVSTLNPLMEGKSAFAITLLFVVIGLITTNFINDVVTCVVLYPIAAQFILDAGGSEMLFAILFSQVTIQGCFMPSGSYVGAMFHGNREWMHSKDVFKWVAIMEVFLLGVLLIVAIIGNIMGV